MRTAALPLAALLCAGCIHVEATSRVERGPLLRTFERPSVSEGGVRATVTAQWPKLFISLQGHDTCRVETVEEYAEEHTTEQSSSAAGPALSAGIVGTVAGAVLFAATPAVSNEPNRTFIDAGGRYGASPRQNVIGWGVVSVTIGIPALVVGAIAYFRQGEETVVKKVEQVTNQKEAICNPREIDGPVQLLSEQRLGAEGKSVAGQPFELDESGLKTLAVDRIVFYGREAELDEGSRKVLDGFSACRQVAHEQIAAVSALTTGALMNRLERVRACRALRPDAMAEETKLLEGEVAARREGGDPGAFPVGPNVTSFEEAVSAYAPRLKLAPGSADLAKLDAVDDLVGQAAAIEGVVTEGVTANIGVLQLGNRQVFLFLPSQRAWGGEYPVGTRVEAVAVVVGAQTLGDRTLPLLRAVWLRPAFGGQ